MEQEEGSMFRLIIFILIYLEFGKLMYRMQEIQISEDPCLLASLGTLLQESQVEGILEKTYKKDLKEGWTLEIVPEL